MLLCAEQSLELWKNERKESRKKAVRSAMGW